MARFAGPPKPWRGGAALRAARSCYDHLAGQWGVALADALEAAGHVAIADGDARLTADGAAHLARLGMVPARGRRPACRACLDWSERRPHLAGAVGAAILAHALAQGWVRRVPGGRVLEVTDAGRAGFARDFGVRAPG